ncbi:hypothetical protein PVAP13_2NG592740 [Panicum virgatum]|uniref:Uncharacterized protein n=1 Tax=Panicum virgatum TaxID=38727 RepID=A0A8T0W1A6_PANVG|nr:hypothetical protein PVAP13_2NG592740 [Panicum virgatum]
MRGNGAWRSAPAALAAAQSRSDAVSRLRGWPQRTPASGRVAPHRIASGRGVVEQVRQAAVPPINLTPAGAGAEVEALVGLGGGGRARGGVEEALVGAGEWKGAGIGGRR